MKDAAAAGYTGVLVSDCKFSRWQQRRGTNGRSTRATSSGCGKPSRDLGLQFIISVCDQGEDLLSSDPNLAEGMPVENAPFVVRGHRLVPADGDMETVNPGLEAAGNGRVPGWYIDELGRAGFVDTQVKAEGKNSIRFENIPRQQPGRQRPHHPAREGEALPLLSPERAGQDRGVRLARHVQYPGPGICQSRQGDIERRPTRAALDHQRFALKPTADWTTLDIAFNTLDSEEVGIYIGSRAGGGASFGWTMSAWSPAGS